MTEYALKMVLEHLPPGTELSEKRKKLIWCGLTLHSLASGIIAIMGESASCNVPSHMTLCTAGAIAESYRANFEYMREILKEAGEQSDDDNVKKTWRNVYDYLVEKKIRLPIVQFRDGRDVRLSLDEIHGLVMGAYTNVMAFRRGVSKPGKN